MGRPKTQYLPYDDAQRYIQQFNLKSRAQYWRWWDKHRPAYVPKRPEKVYSQWSSWNEFLVTTNEFKPRERKKDTYRPFWEAVRYAQHKAKEYNITTQQQWYQWHDSGMCANDVPKYPNHVYEQFVGTGWKTWLGQNLESKINTARENVAVFAIHHSPDNPPNVIVPVVHQNGYHAMVEKMQDTPSLGKVYRLYHWEGELSSVVDQLLHKHGHKQNDNCYIVPNMNGLLWDLDNTLLICKVS